jgi:hypothetical protein
MEFEKVPSEVHFGPKGDKQVDIASRVRLASRKGTEQFKPRNSMTPAERGEPGFNILER